MYMFYHVLSPPPPSSPLPPPSLLQVLLEFLPARRGMLVVTSVEGRNLKNMEMIGKQDPYCKFTLGKTECKGKTVKKGGTDPYFNEEEFEFWIGEDGWTNELVFACYDEDVGSDDLIGGKRFSVFDYMYEAKSHCNYIQCVARNVRSSTEN